uniref:Unannotated protein n=1 Tax=freshwater metagenome TaxID=449393 RepID=A0A6J5ZSG8_9ZZZZ
MLAAALLTAIIVLGGGGSGSGGTTASDAPAPVTTVSKKATTASTYTVRSGDTLSSISIETGIPLATIQELNPDIDTQALQPGQKLQLKP